MAAISLNNEHRSLYFEFVYFGKGIDIEKDPFLLLIEEVIDYSLRHHKLFNWNPPVNLEQLRRMTNFTYFNEEFAAEVVNHDTEEKVLALTKSLGFDEQEWLHITDPYKAIICLEKYLVEIYKTNLHLSQMFSFACYASRIALEKKLYLLVNGVVLALLHSLRKVLPPDEYFTYYYFIPNDQYMYEYHNDQYIDEQINGLYKIRCDRILLFVIELINYSLHVANLHSWVPMIGVGVLARTETTYFTEAIGIAINHHCTEDEAMRAAEEYGFDETKWLELLTPSEAINCLSYFLRQVFPSNNQNTLSMLSFASYCSKLAMRKNCKSLVNQVALELNAFLQEYYPDQQFYRELDGLACSYNVLHDGMHAQSDDEGCGDVGNEPAYSDEHGYTFYQGGIAAFGEEQNEAEESYFQNSTPEMYAEEGSGMNILEEIDASDVLEEDIASESFESDIKLRVWESLEREIRMLRLKAESVTHVSEAESAIHVSEAEGATHVSEAEGETKGLEMQIDISLNRLHQKKIHKTSKRFRIIVGK